MVSPLRFLVLIYCIFWTGCKFKNTENVAPLPWDQQVTWEGRRAISYAQDSLTSIHSFVFLGFDTLKLNLQEFPYEYLAYAAFSQKASLLEMQDGFLRQKGMLVFFHGRYLGEVRYANAGLIPAHFLRMNLKIGKDELFKLPSEFQAFPTVGRIAHSERVHLDNFMGIQWGKPVFSTLIQCYDDTATAFRILGVDSSMEYIRRSWKGHADTLNWGKEIHFEGQTEFKENLLFWVNSPSVLGVLGCSDPQLALGYAQKLQKMTVLLPKL